jgi:peptide/nickel transport system ATP-binding protein
LLRVEDLTVRFPTEDGLVHAVDSLSFTVERGKTLGIVGESGSGKSVTSLAIMGLHRGTSAELSGKIWLEDIDLLGASDAQVRQRRGRRMAMIFQDPLSALHPQYTIGNQIVEAYRLHNAVSKKAARQRAIDMLDRVGIPTPNRRIDDYPHQFSGGMRQRAMIAMSLVCDPELLIADEPTTALDVTVQAQILDLMIDLQKEFGSAIVLITHDLGVVAEVADDVLVMYAGRCVEYGTADEVFYTPEHPYTWGLLGSVPRLDRDRSSRLRPIVGTPPSLITLPNGCAFHVRCPYADRTGGSSQKVRPELNHAGAAHPLHRVACHLPHSERQRLFTDDIRPTL